MSRDTAYVGDVLSQDANPALPFPISNKHLDNQTTDAAKDITEDGYLEEEGKAGDTEKHGRKWLNSLADGPSGDDGRGSWWWSGT